MSTGDTRQARILSILQELYARIIGTEASGLDPDMTFLEMGADSLLLLRASQAIEDRFEVKVPFRKMFEEVSSINALVSYIHGQLPEEAPQIEPEPAEQASEERPHEPEMETESTPGPGLDQAKFEHLENLSVHNEQGKTALERVMQAQLVVMRQQLELLTKRKPSEDVMRPSTSIAPRKQVQPVPVEKSSSDKKLGQKIDKTRFVPYQAKRSATIPKQDIHPRQRQHLDQLIDDVTRHTATSKRIAAESRAHLADNRASAGFNMYWKEMQYPLISDRAKGSRLWDVDGHEYVDVTLGYGCLFFGHTPEFIIRPLQEQAEKGLHIGTESPLAGKAAQILCDLTGNQRATFVNSGTEAVMTTLRLARAVTGKYKMVQFKGCFHGSFDGVMAREGIKPDGSQYAAPAASGIPRHMVDQILLLDLNDPDSLNQIRAHASELAAVLVEPLPSRFPDLNPEAFLKELRAITEEFGIVLIFDEVVTGFRFHPGGAQSLFGVQADLVAYGKAFGGGVPVAAIAGKNKFMDPIDGGQWQYGDDSYPREETTFFAGTYFKHPLIMAPVLSTLQYLREQGPGLQERVGKLTAAMCERLNEVFKQERVHMRAIHFGSLFRFVFTRPGKFTELFYYHLLIRGVFICETRTCYLSTVHTEEDVNKVVQAVEASVRAMKQDGMLPGHDPEPDPDGPKGTRVAPEETSSDKTQSLPLTEAQKQLWALTQISDDAARVYTQGMTLRFKGALRRDLLLESLQMVVDRHASLRTTFSEDGRSQWIQDHRLVALPLNDFSRGSENEKEEKVAEWMDQEMRHPFDLGKGPLLRAHLLRLSEHDHMLVLILHHLITDGLSNAVIVGALRAIYSAKAQGKSLTSKSSPTVQTAPPAKPEDFSGAEQYWLDQFSGDIPILNLPTDQPRPEMQTYASARYQTTIPAELAREIKQLAARSGSTPVMTMLAGFSFLLHYLSGQTDIVTGMTSSSQADEASPNVGYNVNMLPIRGHLTQGMTFEAYVKNTKGTLLDAYTHQSYPFRRLIKKLKLGWDLSRMPLVSVVFNLDKASGSPKFFELETELAPVPPAFIEWDMFLNVVDTGGDMIVQCDYNNDLFREYSIRVWLELYKELWQALATTTEDSRDDLFLRLQEKKLSLWEQDKEQAPEVHRARGTAFWGKRTSQDVAGQVLPFAHRGKARSDKLVTAQFPLAIPEEALTLFAHHQWSPRDFLIFCWQALLWRSTASPEITLGVGLFHPDDTPTQPRHLPLSFSFQSGLSLDETLTRYGLALREVKLFQDTWAQSNLAYAHTIDFIPDRVDSSNPHPHLRLTIDEREDDFEAVFHYEPGRFPEETVRQLAGQLQTLVAKVPVASTMSLENVPILDEQARELLISGFNQTARAVPVDSFLTFFQKQVHQNSDQIAAVFAEEAWTYAELNDRACRLAAHLNTLGVASESLVALCLDRSLEMLLGMLGVMQSGGTYLPLDPSHPADRLKYILEDADPVVILSQASLRTDLPESRAQVVCLDEDWAEIARTSPAEPRTLKREHAAYVIYTSGSTGKPKGVTIGHRALVNFLNFMLRETGLTSEDRLLAVTTVSFDIAGLELYMPLIAGARVVIASRETALDGNGMRELIDKQGVTAMQATPAFWQLLLDAGWTGHQHKPPFKAFSGGDLLTRELANRLLDAGVSLHNFYGPTETTIWSSTHLVTREEGPVPIGKPMDNTTIYVLDAIFEPKPLGVPGDLYIGGMGLARGYFKKPALTAQRFIPDPFSGQEGARLYTTGDQARILPGGIVDFLGRNDFQVKIRGYRVELGEIESVLARAAEIRSAVVLAREDAPGNKRLVAYLIADGGHQPTVTALRRELEQHLPDYMVPTAFVFLDKMPLTQNGKIDRKALPAPEQNRPRLESPYVAPRSATERALARICGEVLGVAQTGIHDNFFDLGMDSILALQIIMRANREGLELRPMHIFRNQTIATLSKQAKGTPLETLGDENTFSLTPIQRWFVDQSLAEPNHYNQSALYAVRDTLNPHLLEQAVSLLLQQHEALRIGIPQESTVTGKIAPIPEEIPFSWVDLRHLPQTRQASVLEHTALLAQQSLDPSTGNLVRVVYYHVTGGTRLQIVVHHLAVDIQSWQILVPGLASNYEHLRKAGAPPSRESVPFSRWAQRLAQHAKSEAIKREAPIWLKQAGIEVPSLPRDFPQGINDEASAATITSALEQQETEALAFRLPKRYQTQINDVLLAALAPAIANWAGGGPALIEVEGHGREALFDDLDPTRTVGWFTALFPVLIRTENHKEPGSLLRSVKNQMRAYPNGGIGYSLLRYLCNDRVIQETLSHAAHAEIAFNYAGRHAGGKGSGALLSAAPESAGPPRALSGLRTHLLQINAAIKDGALTVFWTYSVNIHKEATIRGLAERLNEELRKLAAHALNLPQGVGPEKPSTETFPLSPIQEGMLFHTITEPHSGTYFNQRTFRLPANIPVSMLKASWDEVIQRHAALRMAFSWSQEDPRQILHPKVDAPWTEYDWRDLPKAERNGRLQNLLQEDRERGFLPDQAPLMRFAMIRMDEETSCFVWSYHHLILDGWSMALVLQEVFAMFQAKMTNRAPELPDAPPFQDYLGWLQRQDLPAAEHFWKSYLNGFSTPTPLNFASPSVTDTGHGEDYYGTFSRRITGALIDSLQATAKRMRITPSTVIHGAWAILLSRYCGKEDLVFGSTVSGRPIDLTGAERMVGLLINTLPLRVTLPPEQELTAWLQNLQETQLDIRQYEFTPLTKIQEWCGFPSDRALFDTIFVFENYPVSTTPGSDNANLQIQQDSLYEKTNFPITTEAKMVGDTLIIQIAYDPAFFDRPSAERMLAHFESILTSMVDDPRKQLAEIKLAETQNQQEMLHAFNQDLE